MEQLMAASMRIAINLDEKTANALWYLQLCHVCTIGTRFKKTASLKDKHTTVFVQEIDKIIDLFKKRYGQDYKSSESKQHSCMAI